MTIRKMAEDAEFRRMVAAQFKQQAKQQGQMKRERSGKLTAANGKAQRWKRPAVSGNCQITSVYVDNRYKPDDSSFKKAKRPTKLTKLDRNGNRIKINQTGKRIKIKRVRLNLIVRGASTARA